MTTFQVAVLDLSALPDFPHRLLAYRAIDRLLDPFYPMRMAGTWGGSLLPPKYSRYPLAPGISAILGYERTEP